MNLRPCKECRKCLIAFTTASVSSSYEWYLDSGDTLTGNTLTHEVFCQFCVKGSLKTQYNLRLYLCSSIGYSGSNKIKTSA